jgi:acyl carrier protein
MSELIAALPTSLNKQELLINIKPLMSKRWGVPVEHITLTSNFADDLGLDWLDVVELMVLIEQQFPELEVGEDGELACLADLIENIRVVEHPANKEAGWCASDRGFPPADAL